ncbi:hypothetical protein HYALB_00012353 [Hymenoscyphus albidus]|uniref:Uncharacterized protein n=1 Tax=Hymenoscyphus albidus TaxID=595503 RepID=A0A9N9LQJ0_9HELO|nr:hypothetical protein HYALB_00012353 [Hymenoscyphus albidus]
MAVVKKNQSPFHVDNCIGGLHGTTYTWNPPASLNGQSGSLEISDGLTKDVSPQVFFRPGSEQGQNVIISSSITQSPFETNHPISFIFSSSSRNFEAFSTSTPVPTASGVSTSVSPSPHTRSLDESDNDFAPGFNTGAKVWIAIAITAVICLIGGAITFAFWYRKRSRKVKYGSNAKSMSSAKGFDINTSVEWKAELEAVSNVRHVSPVELDTEPLKLKR